MVIKVTEGDIKLGCKDNGTSCPIAKALKRQIPKYNWFVGCNYVEDTDDWHANWKLPIEARKFIRDFDNDRPVEPFEFKIEFKG